MNVLMSSHKVLVIIVRFLTKFEPSRQISEKYSNIKFHKNASSQTRIVPCGRTERQTDMMMLIVAFRTFTKAPKNAHHSVKCNIITWHPTKYT